MSKTRWTSILRNRRTPLLLVATAATVALTAGCGGGTTTGSGQPSGTSKPSSTTKAPTTSGTTAAPGTEGGKVTVSDAAAVQLCDLIRPQLSDWRVQGPTLGAIALNTAVHEWALRNGGINMQVLGDKDVVDRIMIANCPDVRDQVLSALNLQSMAAGIAF
ncbi:hypothetical protein [Nocardia crassostreae]|uniref:hypothetical protein n=1 Tax=Nocardia crassostreae TaxID=53428 RepID=UPI000ACE18A0|nr:hypothetical protein [Nocardia crassostreae]